MRIFLYCVDLSQELNSTEIQEEISQLKRDYPRTNIIIVGTKADIGMANASQFAQQQWNDDTCGSVVTSAKLDVGIDTLKNLISAIINPAASANEPKTPNSRKLLIAGILFFPLLTLTSILVSAPLAIVISLVVLTSITTIACVYTFGRGQQQETARVPRSLFEAANDAGARDGLDCSLTNSQQMHAALSQGSQESPSIARCIQPVANSAPMQHTKLFQAPQGKPVDRIDTATLDLGM